MDNETKKKNILDLQFQKYLMMASTSIIIAFTYLIGIGIAFLSKQIKLDDFQIMMAIAVISSGVLGVCAIIFFNSTFHLNNIPLAVKEM